MIRYKTYIPKILLILGSLIVASGIEAQDYVFTNASINTYYYANGNTWSNSSSFSPSYIWTITNDVPFNNGRFLIISRSGNRNYTYTPSLSSNNNNTYTLNINDGYYVTTSQYASSSAWTRTTYYLQNNLGNFSTDNANGVGAFLVTTTSVENTSINPTISGDDVLTTIGNFSYTASGATYQAGYTNYRFNNTDHFFEGNTPITPSAATIGYSWGLTSNAYATVNNSGVVNVSRLPESDITLTLTVIATVTGGSPAAPANTTLTTTKDITIQGTKPSAPIITVNGTSVTMTTEATGSTSIRYTLDGSDPTATTGTVYSGAIDLSSSTTSPVIIKAITVRNGNASAITTKEVTLTLPAPVITVDGSAGTASISATSGATIYYTTDGSDPTTSSNLYTGTLTGLSAMTTIKAIAVKEGWNNSFIASETTTIPSGVSGGTVTLFDYEDHNWTYYSGVDASVDGGNYNTNYAGKMYSPNPRNVKITYNGVNGINNSNTRVRVSINENETSFVYYKTLEQGNTSGEYPYQVISNPFSVRPSTGSGNNKVYYGFAGWKIVSGGQYIKNHNNNDVLGLDEDIVFINLPYPSVNCTSAEIVFETTWTEANVQTGNNISTMIGRFSGGTYETNFAILTGTYTTAWTGNKNATITSVYPDGSSNVPNNVYTRLNLTLNDGYTIKYEYIHINNNINNNNTTFSMGSGTKTLYLGRGITNTTNNGVCCNLIQGYDNTINSGGLTYTLKIESGIYNYISYAKGYVGSSTTNTVTGNVSIKGILGCDYDRAASNNNNLKIQEYPIFGYSNGTNYQLLRSPSAGAEVLNITFKSGSLNSNKTSAGTADVQDSFYIGIGGGYSPGYRKFTMEGGEMWSLAAGICQNTATTNSIRFRIKGGLIKGSIYGSAANANSYGYKQIIITGGTIKGWIAGGGNGTSANGGVTTGSSYIYVGGNSRVDSEGSTSKINSSLGGQVFGSGSGVEGTTTWGELLYGSNVVVADNAYIERNVFGGGNFGWTDQYATIYITGEKSSVGNVYGGANQNKGENVRIFMTGGNVREGIYGGSNVTGTISGNVTMQINGGQVGVDANNTANIHGGGYGQATRVSGNVDLTLGSQNQTTPGVTVYGDVYGGSALGYVNGTAATNTYHTYVTMNKGIINGSMYGGGLGNASTAANVYGPVTVTVNGGTVNTTSANGSGAVYGCNNINGAPQRAVAVIINGTDPAPDEDSYALDAVYGGGNQANYAAGTPTVTVNNCDNSIDYVYGGGNAAHITNGNTDVTIFGGNKIGNVFGGGNGTQTAANVSGNTNVKIYGGTILNVFGGSNSQGTIGGTINVTVDSSQGTGCPMNIGNVYGGGNMAPSNAGNLNIVCTGNGGHIDNIFGGANQADITGDIDLKINGGDIGNVFGGNNQSGEISGNIEVTVGDNPNNCETFKIENVYGGGNLAAYGHGNDYPQVNIVSGEITEGVYGGGYGESAVITGNPQVTVKGGTIGSIYGGGNAAAVTGNTIVSVENAAVTEAIYGGSNAANISGTTTVDVISGTVGSGIYGGCNSEGTVGRDIAVNISGGTIGTSDAKANIHGGGYGSSTATSGNVTVNINGSIIHGDVYGGSALGNVNGSTSNTTMVNLTGGTVYGDAYGGGLGDSSNPAYVNGNVTITLNGTAFVLTTTSDDEGNSIPASGLIFGCNNLNGTPKGTVLVKILKTTPANGATRAKGTYEVQAVYGGGNLAAYDPTDPFAEGQFTEYTYSSVTASHDNTDKPVQVVIDGCEETSIEYAYGGGNAAPTPATDVTVIGCYEIGNVIGGGNGKDKYTLDGGTTWNSNNGADVGYKGSTSYGTGTTLASVYGGTVHYIFGGSNTKGNIRVISEAAIDEASDCPLDVEEIYGGGNEAYMEGDSKISLGCIDFLQEIYGGAKNADVGGDIELTITSGHFDRVFGGNNLGGTIEGSITVNIEETGCNPITIGELYGCGNAAAYSTPSGKTDPTINIKSFTSIGRVFGGGLGEGAVVTGNPTVNINEVVGENASMTPTTVYAGTTRTLSDGTTVTLPDHTAGEIGAIGTVFGGGNAAVVNGNTNVYVGTESTITYVSVDESSEPIPVVGVDIRGNVYGGGNAADVTGSTNVVIGQ